MKKKIVLLLLAAAMVLTMTACGCKHETWNDADCVTPKTCAECGETEGEALGHTWMAATCDAPKTCEVCNVTEGEPKGHSWVDADCENPKTCSACKLTEGEALGHVWKDATTEAPKTCETCGKTEGDPILTDLRFTTAANEHLFGTWVARIAASGADLEEMLGMALDGEIALLYTAEFCNDGTLVFSFEPEDPDAFMDLMVASTVESLYQTFEYDGYSRAEADAAIKTTYGMTMSEYVRAQFAVVDITAVFDMVEIKMVYYCEGDTMYVGMSWDTPLEADTYRLEGDNLYLGEAVADAEDIPFVRQTEPEA